MSENAVVEKMPVVAPVAVADLSREIEQSAERQSDEIIKAIRVFDNYYRCNWWVQDKSTHAFWLATGTIRKSKLMRVTKTGTGLQLTDVPDLSVIRQHA